MSHEMMDLRQAARHLHIDENELRHFAQREEVPSVKRGDTFFFEHRLLDEWAQRRMMELSPRQLTGEHRQAMDERRRAQGGRSAGVAALAARGDRTRAHGEEPRRRPA